MIVLYVAVLYTVIIPAHGHADMREHRGCALCQLAGTPAATETVPVMALITVFELSVVQVPSKLAEYTFSITNLTRAPPHC
jgi:hypothetical protein